MSLLDLDRQKAHAMGLWEARRARQNNVAAFNTTHTLQNLTQKCILENIAVLGSHSDHFAKLSPDMKNEVMKTAWSEKAETPEEAQLQRQALLLLLNEQTTSFQFPSSVSAGEQAEFGYLWQGLMAKQPVGLRSLVKLIRFDGDIDWNVRPFVDRVLVCLANLEILVIHHEFECDDTYLARFAEHLPKLRVLDMVVRRKSSKLSREGILALRNLNHLKEFRFIPCMHSYVQPDLLELCYELLPKLHVTGLKPQVFYCGWVATQFGILSNQGLSRLEGPCSLQLQDVVLSSVRSISHQVKMPELSMMYLEHKNLAQLPEEPLSAERFPKLREINFSHTHYEDLRGILGHGVGPQLDTLRFQTRMYIPTQPMDWLLEACPNLTELCLSLDDMRFERELLPSSLPRLEILRVDGTRRPMQQGVLAKLLLAAPRLKMVDIGSSMLSRECLMNLFEQVQQGACLRHLERFRFRRHPDDPNLNHQQWKIYLDVLVVACCVHCQQLRELDIEDGFGRWPHEMFGTSFFL